MTLKELTTINTTTATEETTENSINNLFKAEKIEALTEGIYELDVERVRTFSKGVEIVGRNTDNKRLYKFILWYDEQTEGDFLKSHIQNLLIQVEDNGNDLNPDRLIGNTIVVMAVKGGSGFLNITTDIRRIAKAWKELHPSETE